MALTNEPGLTSPLSGCANCFSNLDKLDGAHAAANAQDNLLSGGTSGIGFALLRLLHAQGHRMLIVGRNQDKLSQVSQDYEGITAYECDLSSRPAVETLARTIGRNHPELSVIFNNAGIQSAATFLDNEYKLEDIEHEVAVNFLAPVWLTYLLLPQLITHNQPSGFIDISSGLALAPKTNSAVYCATKAALHSLSQSLRYQFAGTNIRVHEAILPMVDTPMMAGRGNRKLPADEAARQIIYGINRNKPEIYVGKAKFLPLLMRISPALTKRMMKKY